MADVLLFMPLSWKARKQAENPIDIIAIAIHTTRDRPVYFGDTGPVISALTGQLFR